MNCVIILKTHVWSIIRPGPNIATIILLFKNRLIRYGFSSTISRGQNQIKTRPVWTKLTFNSTKLFFPTIYFFVKFYDNNLSVIPVSFVYIQVIHLMNPTHYWYRLILYIISILIHFWSGAVLGFHCANGILARKRDWETKRAEKLKREREKEIMGERETERAPSSCCCLMRVFVMNSENKAETCTARERRVLEF